MQQFESTRFGTVPINEESIIKFPNGMIGFEDCKRFHLYHNEEKRSPLYYLQSLDKPEVVFTMTDPEQLGVDYQLVLSDEEAEMLALESSDQLAIMLMVYHPIISDAGEVKQGEELRAQARSPLLINIESRLAFQKVGLQPRLVFSNIDNDDGELQLVNEEG